MIDFHTHILPKIDDGSHSVQESIGMLRAEIEQGVQGVILTPHFYAEKDKISVFLERREKSYQSLIKEMSEQRIDFPIRKGGEIYYFQGIGKAKQLQSLLIEGTDTILIEMPFAQWTDEVYLDIERIIEKQKIRVILAHVERYYQFQKNKKIWEQIFELPIYAQINTGGIEKMKKKHFIKKFLKKDVPIVLGSDCHNMQERVPNMKQGRINLENIFGRELLEEIDRIEERLLNNRA